ncbi:Thyroglobulin [Pteropus alecto]|uniref:Thyroglobulin n=1 Tax=Pteropus alecto TaxID=9402 RepID=L5KJY3_PTEAL|nr:Thyroglobulin [Pteropus alecto]
MALALWALSLLGSASLVAANIFEYQVDAQPLRPCELQREKAFLKQADYVPQCAEDGSFQTVQCQQDGRSCWCVGADGREVPGSRQPGRPAACLSFCQLQKQQILLSGYASGTATSYLPQCQDSGDYSPVQCDVRREQCWCVDAEGMEVYGTRQPGKPRRCPRSCEIRNRRLLHGVGDKSPPQCSPDGGFLPVQCKFVNTTDMMVFDLIHSFNRFPDAFATFSAFRSRFPEVSGYCHCADSQGRELTETGLELLLDEIYDTIFAGLDLASTFAETTLFRILQRRFLAVQVVVSGRFRCPTKCEVERFAAANFGHPYIPSCRRNGDYQAVQCPRDGPCWCVDARGKEVHGARSPPQGDTPSCAEAPSCTWERRQALSRLLFGPVGYFSRHSLFLAYEKRQVSRGTARLAPSCPPSIRELLVDSGVLRPVVEGQGRQLSASESLLEEAVRMIFPSRELARLALQFTTDPRRLQQNLFGGRFLANVAQFNLSGALGTRGTFNFSQFFQRLGLPGFQNGGGPLDLAKPLSAGSDSNPAVESPGAAEKGETMNKPIAGSFGFEVNLRENQNALKSLASLLELPEFLRFLQHAVSVPEDIARDLGDVMEVALRSQGCEQAPGSLFVPSCTAEGGYEDVQCFAGQCWCVDAQGRELPGSRVRSGQPRCPTECEKQRAQMQNLLGSQPAGSSLFVPACTREGHFLPVQCFNSECYCVDAEGQAIPGTRSAPGEPKRCPTPCQLQAEQAFLGVVQALVSNSSALPTLSSIYIPQCSARGRWRQMQCDGPPEQVFEWYERWRAQNDDDGQELPPSELLTKIMSYREAASGSFRLFIQSLYEAGQQGIFPGLARYSSFHDVPLAVLEGNRTQPGESTLLEPYPFWQILNGQLGRYPGPYSDFSSPLSHFDLRTCWCVDRAGQELEGTRTGPNKAPACPGSCAEVKLRVLQFMKETEEIVLASNSSQLPLGESFLAAKGIRLTKEELALPPLSPSQETISEKFLTRSDYAMRLAAQSTLDFYLRRRPGYSSRAAALLRSGPYVPQCDAFGSWEPVQCHARTGHCWCVDGEGEYLSASLTARSPQTPPCPQCPLPFDASAAAGGVILCERASGPGGAAIQQCQLLCRQGYRSAFPPRPLVCSLERRRWVSQPPQPRACQRFQLWQTLQTQARFQLQPGGPCSADDAGLSPAFQVFILDALMARGFCQIQVKTFGTPVSIPVCDDSMVQVECLTQERLGVNVTWKLQLEDVPPASLPDLHDIEDALVGKGPVGRFADLVQSGAFQLHLDNKTFPADTSIYFLQGDSFGTSPRTRFGCLEGFYPVSDTSDALRDPLGCGVTDCQKNEAGLQCDQDGRYRASQRDGDSGKAFCVDGEGQRLPWSETDARLMDSQCLVMQKFEKAPESKVVFDADVAVGVKSRVPGSESPLVQCLAECASDEACSFLTVSTVGSEVSCDFYAWTRDNIACTTSGQVQAAMGNSKAIGFGSLRCQVRVRSGARGSPAVYLKKDPEFTTTSQKSFEQTGFQNTLSGMYSPVVFPASAADRMEVHLFCLLACDRDSCCDGFILMQVRGGPIICGLLSSPDVLLCNVEDWRNPSEAQANATCPGMTYDRASRQVTLRLGGQEFKNLTTELFSPVDLNQVTVSGNRTLPSQQHWLFKHLFSPQQANLWCLSRCVQEPSFCQLAEIRDSAPLYFTCTLYPDAQVCDDILESSPKGCSLILPHRPETLFRKKVVLQEKVKNFYTRLPFQKLAGISIRSKVPMSDKPVSNGFFECERRCDVDPCCVGFGFLNVSQLKGGEVTCLTLNNLGLQTCSDENGGTWRVLDCGSPDTEVRTYPFGWYQKPVQNNAPSFCPPVVPPSPAENVAMDVWQSLAVSSVVVDPSIRNFDVAHVSTAVTSDFSAARDLCLLECSRHQACLVTTLQTRPAAVRCVFYADTQFCTHSLQAQNCRLLVREEATYIYRKSNSPLFGFGTSAPSVTIAAHGQLLGKSQAIQVGTSWKHVDQFWGVPYAAPPLAEGRFRAPERWNWTGSWDATEPRVSEDCLYLNVFVPEDAAPNASVLVFFHNTLEGSGGEGRLALDGSFLAAVGNLIVVTAGYRVGVFGFLSSGSGEVSGNWGLLDQVAALTWVQTHIGVFGGDSRRVALAADRGGADVASIHLLPTGAATSSLFQRALLMGGSVLSPAAVISQERAQQQAVALAKEVDCPTSSVQEMVSCFRQKPADVLNDAQTKLLAVSGPFHYWGPVVDGQYLRQAPATALQKPPRAKVDLLIGSSQDDGLINRAKAVKRFEESQGRTSSKIAFYQALQNSLGGEGADAAVQAAATWYYSLEHSADDYASFSRALENATRDYFITCPVIDMANQWARETRGSVFMYHAPESYGHSSLELLADVQYAFGLPFHPAYEGQFTPEEKSVSLKIMQYFSNFIRSGNPNYPHEFSRKAPEFAAPWPDFVPGADGENYKEFSSLLPNRQGLKKADCSFWSKYIRSLKVSADEAKGGPSAESEEDRPASGLREDLLGLPDLDSKSYSK